jgi:hypothetical protein
MLMIEVELQETFILTGQTAHADEQGDQMDPPVANSRRIIGAAGVE